MKKVYEAPVLETLRYVFSQPVATEIGDDLINISGLLQGGNN